VAGPWRTPHTEQLKVIERFRRVNFGRIERQVTLVDEEFYRQPIVVNSQMNFAADTDTLEYVCNENPKESSAFGGSDETGAERGRAARRSAALRRDI
jgi:hypothetical protein